MDIICQALVKRAREKGSQDDCTAMVPWISESGTTGVNHPKSLLQESHMIPSHRVVCLRLLFVECTLSKLRGCESSIGCKKVVRFAWASKVWRDQCWLKRAPDVGRCTHIKSFTTFSWRQLVFVFLATCQLFLQLRGLAREKPWSRKVRQSLKPTSQRRVQMARWRPLGRVKGCMRATNDCDMI